MPEKMKYGLRIAVPVLIGLGAAVWLMSDDLHSGQWSTIHLSPLSWLWLLLACLLVCGRDFGLTWRYRILSQRQLSWAGALRVDLMCAFTSAITPSAVGGSAMGMVYMNQEGIPFGRAVMLSMATLFFDQMFLALSVPVVVAIFPHDQLFGSMSTAYSIGINVVFWVVYVCMAGWALILLFGLVIKPQAVKALFTALFRIKGLRRWAPKVDEMTANMMSTSEAIRHQRPRWWLTAFAATCTSWFSRFGVVNMLFLAFAPWASQALVIGRQVVLQIALTISPTPGASGISEWIFSEYFGDLFGVAGTALVVALIWRLLSYYVYLIAGACLLPSYFIKRK